jgi:hypothetical protein
MSVKREVVHIRASRFELIKMVQTFLYRNRTGASHEASDDLCFRGCRSIRRRDRHAVVSFARAVRRNRCYALVGGAPHRGRRQ